MSLAPSTFHHRARASFSLVCLLSKFHHGQAASPHPDRKRSGTVPFQTQHPKGLWTSDTPFAGASPFLALSSGLQMSQAPSMHRDQVPSYLWGEVGLPAILALHQNGWASPCSTRSTPTVGHSLARARDLTEASGRVTADWKTEGDSAASTATMAGGLGTPYLASAWAARLGLSGTEAVPVRVACPGSTGSCTCFGPRAGLLSMP